MSVDDFDVGANAPTDRIAILNDLFEEAIEYENKIEQMEADLKALKKTAHSLKTQRIPDLMMEMQLDSAVFKGWKIKVDDFISGTLPREPLRRKQALEWLEEHGGSGIITSDISVSFSREEYDGAKALAEELKEKGQQVSMTVGVHAMTLRSFAKEKIKNGEPIDFDTLGLYTGKIAKLKKDG